MRKTRLVVLLIIGIFFLSITTIAEEITLTTYYPAPYGEYQQLYVSGNVGIGTTSPRAKLHIANNQDQLLLEDTDAPLNEKYWLFKADGDRLYLLAANDNWDNFIEAIRFNRAGTTIENISFPNGNVGIGTTNPTRKLHVNGIIAMPAGNQLRFEDLNGTYRGAVVHGYPTTDDISIFTQGDGSTPRFVIKNSGNVGIGRTGPTARLHVNGNIKAVLNNIDGASPANMRYNSGTNEIGYDVAELFESNEEVEPGDILSIDENGNLKRSGEAYDTKVAGIVSEAPAILFEGNQLQIAPQAFAFQKGNKPPLALAGRVRCNATTEEGGPIKRGDLLVTSSKAGYAMRARPENVRIGTVLGKALEPLDSGEGKITVLVTLQ